MLDDLNGLMRNFQENYLMTARDFAQWGAYEDAVLVLKQCTKNIRCCIIMQLIMKKNG